jgi:uncharacterized protein (TIGR03437 family)
MYRKKSMIFAGMAIAGIGAFSAPAQTNTVASVSSASYSTFLAPGSIASAWGSGLSTTTVSANTSTSNGQAVMLPTMLGSVSLALKDSRGGTSTPQLYLVSPGQINYVISDGAALGSASLAVQTSSGALNGSAKISNVAPALYTADASGAGVPIGSVFRLSPSNTVTLDNTFQTGTTTYMPKPVSVSGSDRVYLILYGTGIRNRSLNPAVSTIGDVVVPVAYAGAQSTYPGFDQVNVGPLPATLAGKGAANLILFVDGVPSNTVQIAIQ